MHNTRQRAEEFTMMSLPTNTEWQQLEERFRLIKDGHLSQERGEET